MESASTSSRNYQQPCRFQSGSLKVLAAMIAMSFFFNLTVTKVHCNPRFWKVTVEAAGHKSITAQEQVAKNTTEQELVAKNTTAQEPSKPRVLVAFTGPTLHRDHGRTELYMRNTDHFLRYGVQCRDRDTIIAVGEEYYDHYYPIVKAIRDSQCRNGHFVHLVSRREVCYDMETVRLIVTGGVAGVNWNEYDYFAYVNCGVTGPHPEHKDTWLQLYLSKLKAPVHLTGLSANCDRGKHIQSMVYAADRVGMDLIRPIPFDCTKSTTDRYDIIDNYEVGMSRKILEEGHSIAAVNLQSGVVLSKDTNCELGDLWWPEEMKKLYGDRPPSWKESIFWKSSRSVTPEIQEVLNGKTDFT